MQFTINKMFAIPSRTRGKRYLYAVWPCGTRWRIEGTRGDWSAPIYKLGEQTNITICCDTRRDLISELEMEGAIIKSGI